MSQLYDFIDWSLHVLLTISPGINRYGILHVTVTRVPDYFCRETLAATWMHKWYADLRVTLAAHKNIYKFDMENKVFHERRNF